MRITLVAAVVGMAVFPVLAQERQRDDGSADLSGDALYLLTRKSVQEELKLSDEQATKVAELWEGLRVTIQQYKGLSREEVQKKREESAKARREAIVKLLDPEQLKRLKQITVQVRVRALPHITGHPEIVKVLQITSEQSEKIKEIRAEGTKRMMALGRLDEQARKKIEESRKELNKRVLEVLTAEQKKKLKGMQGEPFKGDLRTPASR